MKIQVPESQAKWADDAKRRSYPLPLPPGVKSAAESSSHSRERGENVESPWKKGKLLGKGLFGEVFIGFNRWAIWLIGLDLVGIFALSLFSMWNLDSWLIILIIRIMGYLGSTLSTRLLIYSSVSKFYDW